jgi:glutathione S-transferase
VSEVILHHYELSPFGTAMRLALGHKGLHWKSVEAPLISPKPDLSALTGGYERIPVLQIGADIYCDTACITAALETHKAEPTFYPGPTGLAGKLIALWAGNSWFIPAVGTALGGSPASAFPDDFWADRAARFGIQKEAFLQAEPHLKAQFVAGAQVLAAALEDGRAFIGGDAAGHADFILYMNVNFAGMAGVQASDYGPQVGAWFDRVTAIGFGDVEQWSPEQAIQHAAESDPIGGGAVAQGSGFKQDQPVIVGIDAPDPAEVEGNLVALDDTQMCLSREDSRAGKVHVHFPRMGMTLRPA